MYSFKVCPQCGKMSFPLDVTEGNPCPFCGHEIILVKYNGRLKDGSNYAQDDFAKQQKDIMETVVMPNPEFNKKLFEKRMNEEYTMLHRTVLYIPSCTYCGSSNIQYEKKKRFLRSGYKMEKYCGSCGKKYK